jgi:hypothetical protein
MALLVGCLPVCTGAADAVPVHDDPIRMFAETTVLPRYPMSAIRQHLTGVAVARVVLGQTRRLYSVDILEAPSPAIGLAVREALAQWRFGSPEAESQDLQLRALGISGKLLAGKVTFYFFESNGRYIVAGPKEAPNIVSAR